MKTMFAIALCAGMLCAQAVQARQVQQAPQVQQNEHIAPATQAAEQWLTLTDAAQYQASWDGAADAFQKAVTGPAWQQALQSARAPLGALRRRTLTSANYATSLPGAPAGQYVVIVYTSDFANRSGVTETVTPMLGADGKWKVSGYFIK